MRTLVATILVAGVAAALGWRLLLPRAPSEPLAPQLHLPEGGARITLVQRHDA